MTTSNRTLKGIAAAATVGSVIACGAAPQSDVSSVDPGDNMDQVTTTTDAADDSVPWAQLLDGDRIERTHSNRTIGCVTVDTMLPC